MVPEDSHHGDAAAQADRARRRGRTRRRAALRRALRDVMVQLVFNTARLDTTMFDALLEARAMHGSSHLVLDDIDQQPMTYGG